MRRRDLLKAAPLPFLPAPAIAQAQKPLRFVPQANLSALDPVWTTATVVINHSFMVYDTLYGLDLDGAGSGGAPPRTRPGGRCPPGPPAKGSPLEPFSGGITGRAEADFMQSNLSPSRHPPNRPVSKGPRPLAGIKGAAPLCGSQGSALPFARPRDLG